MQATATIAAPLHCFVIRRFVRSGMGKIIQITSCGHENTLSTKSNLTLFALCDDGRLWALGGASWKWNEVPLPIPETNDDDPHPH